MNLGKLIVCDKCKSNTAKLTEIDEPVYEFKCSKCNLIMQRYKIECEEEYEVECTEDCEDDDGCLHENYEDCKEVNYYPFDRQFSNCNKCDSQTDIYEVLENYFTKNISNKGRHDHERDTDQDLICSNCQITSYDTSIIRTENRLYKCLDCESDFLQCEIQKCDKCNTPNLGELGEFSALEGCYACED